MTECLVGHERGGHDHHIGTAVSNRLGGSGDRRRRPPVSRCRQAHTVAAFGQPVFAGVYLSGAVGGLHWHARGADLVFSLGLLQTVAGTAASVRMRRVWPVTVSLLVVAAETVQYMAGLSGALWLHLPLGAAIIASLAVLFVAAWIRPLPNAAHG
ncbi:hypothetical protein AB0L04_28780 [Streptomyces glaucescens]|uniref:hypothetical protein n=1 Tax=Streptomyces glaucescens TaxID=1907 RepID=UPI00344F317A